MWLVVAVGFAIVALAHMAPLPFLLDLFARERAVWHMPRNHPPTIYLTYDDGPNPTTTPDLLDVLAREGVHVTSFLIDEHVTDETAPIVRRMFEEGHAVALHSASRGYVVMPASDLAATLTAAAGRIEAAGGVRPCRAFRPARGWRSGTMYAGLQQIDYKLIGWGWMLWDTDWFRARSADRTVGRIGERVSAGDIVVLHDGNEAAPREDLRETVTATARLIPELRARQFRFGTVCQNGG